VLIGMMDSVVVLIDMLGKAFSYFEDRGGQKKTANEVGGFGFGRFRCALPSLRRQGARKVPVEENGAAQVHGSVESTVRTRQGPECIRAHARLARREAGSGAAVRHIP
jgi:hypothetical protein